MEIYIHYKLSFFPVTFFCFSQAMKRTLDFNGFINSYKAHLERIMERHGVKDPKAFLAFNELLEYIESRNSKI